MIAHCINYYMHVIQSNLRIVNGKRNKLTLKVHTWIDPVENGFVFIGVYPPASVVDLSIVVIKVGPVVKARFPQPQLKI